MAKRKWLRTRHKAVFAVLRGIFGIHTKIKYNYKAEKSDLKPPFLLMSNHTTALDPFFASLSFKCPIYFCSTDDLFNIPVATPIIKFLVAPIPKMKSGMDMHAIRDCVRVAREGGAVGIFPEGNRTLSGAQWEMTDAVSKFVKMCNVPLVLYNIEGGYGSDPRWGTKIRKGKMRGYVKAVLTPDEFKNMSNEQLYEFVCKNLTVYDADSGVKFKNKRRAENIQRALYMCPHCGKISTITSKRTKFKCVNCNNVWTYTEDLHIEPADKFDTVLPWYEWQCDEMRRLVQTTAGFVISDNAVKLYRSGGGKRKKRLAKGSVSADREGITFSSKRNETRFLYRDMSGFAIVRKNKFEFYVDGITYQITGDDKFCSVKYLHLYQGVNL